MPSWDAHLLGRNPGSHVVTVFSGFPNEDRALSDRDQACGYDSTASMIRMRKEEDLLASFLLEATPIWLDFVASQHGAQPQVARIAAALQAQVGRLAADAVVFPLGLGHAGHRLASEACLRLCAQAPDRHWIVHADALIGTDSGIVATRIDELERRGWSLQALRSGPTTPAKRHAVDCYASHLQGLATPGHPPVEKAFGSERYWQIVRSD